MDYLSNSHFRSTRTFTSSMRRLLAKWRRFGRSAFRYGLIFWSGFLHWNQQKHGTLVFFKILTFLNRSLMTIPSTYILTVMLATSPGGSTVVGEKKNDVNTWMFAPKCKNEATQIRTWWGIICASRLHTKPIQRQEFGFILGGLGRQDSFREWVVEKCHEFDPNPTSSLESTGRPLYQVSYQKALYQTICLTTQPVLLILVEL